MPEDSLSSLPQFWQIWKNPIFTRYRRSKLRISALITGALLYGGLSVFILLVSIGITSEHLQTKFEDAAIYPFIALIFLQIMIMNFGGTGAVAAGMARESIDDVLTYQRLTPLSPLTKVIGYLTGLPIRQYYHTLTTVPVTIALIFMGGIEMKIWLPIYTVLFTSTIMFHLLAMSVGFIMGKKFSALISQGLVALLYLAFPQLSKFGFVVFEYLTMRPTLFISLQGEIPINYGRSETAMFFNWEISHTWYSIAVQTLLSLVFLSILLRRWRQESAHLLSKAQSVLMCAVAHTIILGGIWANTSNGAIFDVDFNQARPESKRFPTPPPPEQKQGIPPELLTQNPKAVIVEEVIEQNPQYVASTIIGVYGLISLALAVLLQYLYTPDKFTYFAGIRQRLKDGRSSFALFPDSASAIPTTLVITVMSIYAWLLYSRHLLNTAEIQQYLDGRSWQSLETLIILTLSAPLLGHGFAMEQWGKKLIGTMALFIWVIPLAIALLGTAWNLNQDIFGLLYGFSPLAMVFAPAFGLTHLDYLMDRPFIVGSLIGTTLYFALSVIALTMIIKRHKLFLVTQKRG
ncbi:hypothetical protein SAMN02745181_1974 [Rubritalea squalenifaciens DSM 18772]|uniref:Uncharacterized protein n=1 Tax=Rubritalea squalenifaciens DSM 18772 TaxID=1123071 RepID=A0A1M6J0X8_9BACT|nr:hypothetical protein [Rubritalea squalenifaciens]SHJ40311.1 hypothetical protein SAMN02745181_1974 [Rubritalea squalenifaciens DSM 18772]